MQECFQSLKHCFGDQSSHKGTVFRWFRQFMSGTRSLEDDDRCGRTATTHMLRKFDRGRSRRVWDIVTGDETWVYQYDLETKQPSAVWVFPDEDPPVKFKRNRSDWYVNHCLPKVFQAWCTRRSQTGVRGLLLHHDNASAHTASVALDFLATNDVQLVTHPPYSPDLAPCDWFLFPSVKRKLKGKQFQNAEDARAFIEGVILDISQST